jgi:hypothetical protein
VSTELVVHVVVRDGMDVTAGDARHAVTMHARGPRREMRPTAITEIALEFTGQGAGADRLVALRRGGPGRVPHRAPSGPAPHAA